MPKLGIMAEVTKAGGGPEEQGMGTRVSSSQGLKWGVRSGLGGPEDENEGGRRQGPQE